MWCYSYGDDSDGNTWKDLSLFQLESIHNSQRMSVFIPAMITRFMSWSLKVSEHGAL
jgi:hypothetical protein